MEERERERKRGRQREREWVSGRTVYRKRESTDRDKREKREQG